MLNSPELPSQPHAALNSGSELDGKIAFLQERFKFFIKDYKAKRNNARRLSNTFTLVTILSGTFLTLLLGIKSINMFAVWESELSLLALTLSVAITALNAWLSFTDYKWKWIRYRATLSTLYTIQDDFQYMQTSLSPNRSSKCDEIFELLKRTVHETNEEWMSQRGNAITGANTGNGSSSK